jgi:uncharacterized protein DUF4160
MPEIHRLSNRVKVCMYPDHAPPHFHLRGPGWSAMFDLRTFAVIRADRGIPKREIKRAQEWASVNAEFLEQEWERLNERDN